MPCLLGVVANWLVFLARFNLKDRVDIGLEGLLGLYEANGSVLSQMA